MTDTIQVSRAEYEALQKKAARYEYLRERLIAADFDYEDSGECVLIFSWPRMVPVGGDCDKNVDAAINMPANGEGGEK